MLKPEKVIKYHSTPKQQTYNGTVSASAVNGMELLLSVE